MQSLFEKWRPRTFDDLIGQDKAVSALKRIQARGGFGGRAYWITGASGTGKTTIARIIANDLASEWCISEFDARDCTVESVRGMVAAFRTRALFEEKPGKVWIINEADDLRADVLARFKTALEPIPGHCAVIFTCTRESANLLWEDSEDAPQFLSRCIPVSLTSKGLSDSFAKRAHDIAEAEGMNGKEMPWYKRLAMDKRNNMRAMLSAIESGEAMP